MDCIGHGGSPGFPDSVPRRAINFPAIIHSGPFMNSEIIRKSWIARHPRTVLLLANVILLCGLELLVRVFAFYGAIRIARYPTSSELNRYLGDINPHFGVWHYPNRTVQYASPCFDVSYSSNSYGARDRERSLETESAQRVVVLGDSFVEGVGVDQKFRMTDLAEMSTGVEFLNFGVSGSFGSIQQWQLYKDLATDFEHTHIALFLLPDNDFIDNDPEHFPARRFRPYLKKNPPGPMELYYPVKFSEREIPDFTSGWKTFRRELYNQIYLLNIIRQIGEIIETSSAKQQISNTMKEARNSGYLSFTELDLERLFFSYDQIIAEAQGKPVTVFVIPREYELDKPLNNSGMSPLIQRLEAFAQTRPGFKVVDLLPRFLAYAKEHGIPHSDFFHSCDGHWDNLGNQVAADVLAESITGPLKGT